MKSINYIRRMIGNRKYTITSFNLIFHTHFFKKVHNIIIIILI